MKLRFLTRPQQPDRKVRPHAPDAPAAPPPADRRRTPVVQFVPAQDHAVIREAHARAEALVQRLEGHAREQLAAALPLTTRDRPQLREAVRTLRGDHPTWGTEEGRALHRVETGGYSEPEVTVEVLERAVRTAERADRITFGFDTLQITEPGFDGHVRPSPPIVRPEEASGESTHPDDAAARPIGDVVDSRTRMQKRDLWLMAFLALVWQILNTVADILGGWASFLEGAIKIKIGPFKFNAGKWLAKPVRWVERLVRRIARKFELEAEGIDPDPGFDDEPLEAGLFDDRDLDPSSAPDPETANDLVRNADPVRSSGSRPYGRDDDRDRDRGADGGSGLPYLVASVAVLTAVDAEARSPTREDNTLLEAVETYVRARRTRRHLDGAARTATGLGVSLTGPASGLPAVVVSENQGSERVAFECDR